MADPARRMDEPQANRPITPDPFNPMPPLDAEATLAEERYANANERAPDRPVVNRVDVQAERRTGTSVLIAAVVLIIALIAYLVFASGDPETAVPPAGPAVTEPSGEAAPAPNAVAPAEPNAAAPTEPNAAAPAEPATEPNAGAPADTAPGPTAPAETAPSTPAPAQ
jgi:hypothetical protein